MSLLLKMEGSSRNSEESAGCKMQHKAVGRNTVDITTKKGFGGVLEAFFKEKHTIE